MKRVGTVVLLLAGLCSGVRAQALTGSVTGTLAGGWTTNTYLDDQLRSWYEPDRAGGFDVRPAAHLTLSGARSAATVTGSLYSSWTGAGNASAPIIPGSATAWSTGIFASHRLAPSWTVGGTGGIRRVHLAGERRSGWAIPYARWHPGGGFTMDLQVGRSGQTRTDTSGRRSRYRSWVGMARATWWPSGRWRVRASGYWSDSERMASAPGYRGTGGRVALQFHPSARWTVGADAGLERIGYRYEATDWSLDPGRANRLMAEGGLRVTRRLGERVELFAQTRLLASGLRRPTDGPSWDRRARGGIRIELQGTLWREESARQPSGWRMEDGTLRLEVPYEGPGRLYLTGSFNQWAEPGRPLRSTERGTYVITTEVPPGRHEFAIRVEGDEERSWLELPDGIPTVQDGFGRENGVLYASDG